MVRAEDDEVRLEVARSLDDRAAGISGRPHVVRLEARGGNLLLRPAEDGLELRRRHERDHTRAVTERPEGLGPFRVERHLGHRDHDELGPGLFGLLDRVLERPPGGLLVVVTDEDRLRHPSVRYGFCVGSEFSPFAVSLAIASSRPRSCASSTPTAARPASSCPAIHAVSCSLRPSPRWTSEPTRPPPPAPAATPPTRERPPVGTAAMRPSTRPIPAPLLPARGPSFWVFTAPNSSRTSTPIASRSMLRLERAHASNSRAASSAFSSFSKNAKTRCVFSATRFPSRPCHRTPRRPQRHHPVRMNFARGPRP